MCEDQQLALTSVNRSAYRMKIASPYTQQRVHFKTDEN